VHSNGHAHTRASKVGSLVRRLHIDESPQLLLVLQGNMSAVGIRPAVVEEFDMTMDVLSPEEQREYVWARSVCPPGIVTPDSYDQHDGIGTSAFVKAMNTIHYARNASFRLDSELLGRSGAAVYGEVIHE